MRRALLRGKLELATAAPPLVGGGARPCWRSSRQPDWPRDSHRWCVGWRLQIASPAQLDAALAGAHRNAGQLAPDARSAGPPARERSKHLLPLLDRVTSAGLGGGPASSSDRHPRVARPPRWRRWPSPGCSKRPEPAVIVAAANLVRDAILLDTPIARYDRIPEDRWGPLAVRPPRARREHVRRGADQAGARQRRGPSPPSTRSARHGVAGHRRRPRGADPGLARRPPRSGPRHRGARLTIRPSLAPRSMSRCGQGTRAMQIAATRALTRARGNRVAILHRAIGDVVTRARGEVLAEMLAAAGADRRRDRFREDTLRRAKLLDPKYQVVVRRRRWRLRRQGGAGPGQDARAALARSARRKRPRPWPASRARAAQKALASHPPASARRGPPSPSSCCFQEAVQLARASRR